METQPTSGTAVALACPWDRLWSHSQLSGAWASLQRIPRDSEVEGGRGTTLCSRVMVGVGGGLDGKNGLFLLGLLSRLLSEQEPLVFDLRFLGWL